MAPIAKRETEVTLNEFYSADLDRGGNAKRQKLKRITWPRGTKRIAVVADNR